MTREKALKVWHDSVGFDEVECSYKLQEAISTAFRALDQEPCEDCISRQVAIDAIFAEPLYKSGMKRRYAEEAVPAIFEKIKALPPVTPKPKMGRWLRMSDLSEQEDDRYKCSRCGNVIHHKNKMDLYTFNSWCGRCGSDNGRKREVK